MNYPIAQNGYQSQSPRSYPQYYRPPLPSLPPLPPPPTLPEVVHGISGIVSLIALGAAIFGNDSQRATAINVLGVSAPLFASTSPKPLTPLPAPAPTIRADYTVLPAKATASELEEQMQTLKRDQDEIARQLATTQAELTLVRVALFWDDDNT